MTGIGSLALGDIFSGDFIMKAKTAFFTVFFIACAGNLSGCVPVIAGSMVAGTATVATDRRMTGTMVNDEVMESRIAWEIGQKIPSEDSHLTVTCYNGKVLLTGEMASEEEKLLAERVAKASLDVDGVVNEIAVRKPVPVSQRLSDASLAAAARSRIIGTSGAKLNQMKVVVDRGIVYLMGLVTEAEGTSAANAVAQTKGVVRVVKVFEYLTAEEIQQRMKALNAKNENSVENDGAVND